MQKFKQFSLAQRYQIEILLQKAFPDEVQGSKGFIRKEAEVKTPKHFNIREPLKFKNGAHVVVSN